MARPSKTVELMEHITSQPRVSRQDAQRLVGRAQYAALLAAQHIVEVAARSTNLRIAAMSGTVVLVKVGPVPYVCRSKAAAASATTHVRPVHRVPVTAWINYICKGE